MSHPNQIAPVVKARRQKHQAEDISAPFTSNNELHGHEPVQPRNNWHCRDCGAEVPHDTCRCQRCGGVT